MKYLFAIVMLLTVAPVDAQVTQRLGGQAAIGVPAAESLRFSASSILNPLALRGPGYQVSEVVVLKDYRYQFEIVTEFGTFYADGIFMLEKRLLEFQALERARQIGNGPVIVKSAWKTIQETRGGARTVLTDPLGALRRAPRGFEQVASSVVNRLDRRAGGADRKELAFQIGADPETQNPVLRHTLNQLSVRTAIGKGVTKTALGAAVPGLGLLATTEEFREQVTKLSPHEIANSINAELQQSGVWKPVREDFAYGEKYTTIEKLIFMSYFRKLRDVKQIGLFVNMANRDSTEAGVLTRISELRLLSELHQASPVVSISDGGFPVAMLQDGRVFGVCSVDYLNNTPEVQRAAAGYRKANPDRALGFISTGYLSPEAEKTFRDSNISFIRADYALKQVPKRYQSSTNNR